jgi:MoxR-like ATPase
MEITLDNLAATEALAAGLAALARPGDALLLEGPLGAGKSALARAFLRAATGDAGLEVLVLHWRKARKVSDTRGPTTRSAFGMRC